MMENDDPIPFPSAFDQQDQVGDIDDGADGANRRNKVVHWSHFKSKIGICQMGHAVSASIF